MKKSYFLSINSVAILFVLFILLPLKCYCEDPESYESYSPSPPLGLSDLHKYGKECAEQLGVEFPKGLSCIEGTLVPTFGGNSSNCDRPSLIHLSDKNHCMEGNSINRTLLNKSGRQVTVQAICRQNPRIVSIYVFEHETARTCWLERSSMKHLDLDEKKKDGRNTFPRPWSSDPLWKTKKGPWLTPEGKLLTESEAANIFWDTPEVVAAKNCNSCHDSDIFIHSPWIDQIQTSQNAVPSDPFHPDYIHIGKDFKNWFKIPRIKISSCFARNHPDLSPKESEKDLYAPSDSCTSCHYVGGDVTCKYFAKNTTGRSTSESDRYLKHMSDWGKSYPNHVHFWMPPSDTRPSQITDKDKYFEYYKYAFKALEFCCANPDDKGPCEECKKNEFLCRKPRPGENVDQEGAGCTPTPVSTSSPTLTSQPTITAGTPTPIQSATPTLSIIPSATPTFSITLPVPSPTPSTTPTPVENPTITAGPTAVATEGSILPEV